MEFTQQQLLSAVKEYGLAVMEATKAQGTSVSRNKKEERTARQLLRLLLDRPATNEEIDFIIPG